MIRIILMALIGSTLVYKFVEFMSLIVYKKYYVQKKRLDHIESQSLYGYSEKKRKVKEGRKLSIEVPEKLKNDLKLAGINLRPDEFMMLWGMLLILPLVISVVLEKGVIIALALIIAAIMAPPLFIKNRKNARKKQFNDQLGDAIMIISNSLRAGFTFEQALSSISKDLPDPVGPEFSKIIQEVNLGEKLEVTMSEVAERMESKEMELMNTAVAIQRQVGGNLADVLDNIGASIRDRIVIRKNIKALTAQGEISGKVIALLPIVVLVMISMVNPEYMEPLFSTPFGFMLLGVSAFLEILGYAMIKKLINIEM